MTPRVGELDGAELREVAVVDDHPAGVGLHQARHDLDQQGLAGAAWTDQAELAAFVHVEGDVVEDALGVVVLDDALDPDHVPSRVASRSAWPRAMNRDSG